LGKPDPDARFRWIVTEGKDRRLTCESAGARPSVGAVRDTHCTVRSWSPTIPYGLSNACAGGSRRPTSRSRVIRRPPEVEIGSQACSTQRCIPSGWRPPQPTPDVRPRGPDAGSSRPTMTRGPSRRFGHSPAANYRLKMPTTRRRFVAPRTGFATRRAWSETFRHEAHRLARYGCRVTVVAMEIEGLDSAAPTLGQGAADRLIPPLAAVMLQNTRAADVLARIGRRRFVALLPETDEVAAINYVERVRCACDMWMEARGWSAAWLSAGRSRASEEASPTCWASPMTEWMPTAIARASARRLSRPCRSPTMRSFVHRVVDEDDRVAYRNAPKTDRRR